MTLQVLLTVQLCTLLCSKRPVLALRSSELRPGPRKSSEKSVAQSMHTNARNVLQGASFLLALVGPSYSWPTGLSFSLTINLENA